MIDLVRHIEFLLLENDCVILPDFGGFVAYYTSAKWCKEECQFLPPCRTIGFNPQLKMNDGILVQSYMEAYNVDFVQATQLVNQDVQKLIHTLHQEGKVELLNIGELNYLINGSYAFHPYNDKIVSPSFYGFSSFEMLELKELKKHPKKVSVPMSVSGPKRHYEIRINRTWLHNSIAAMIAVILFFSFSTPIENTEVEKVNYAQLMPADLFEKIEKRSLLTSLVGEDLTEKTKEQKEEITHTKSIKPTIVSEEVPNATALEEDIDQSKTQPKVTKEIKVKDPPYYIIIASVTKEKDGEEMVQKLKASGYEDAKVISGNDKIRVSIKSCYSREEANTELKNIRKISQYKDAWLLSNNK